MTSLRRGKLAPIASALIVATINVALTNPKALNYIANTVGNTEIAQALGYAGVLSVIFTATCIAAAVAVKLKLSSTKASAAPSSD